MPMLPYRRVLLTKKTTAAAVAWYLAGGVPSANCLAAYQPKGAADYAAALLNLVNPGTYDLTEGNAPNWDATNGLKFDGVANYLKTGITPGSGYSVLMCFSNWGNTGQGAGISEAAGGVKNFAIRADSAADNRVYRNGTESVTDDSVTEGVMLMAALNCYYNGTLDGTIVQTVWTPSIGIYVGAINSDGAAANFGQFYLQSMAIYNADVSAYQSDLYTAIAAL